MYIKKEAEKLGFLKATDAKSRIRIRKVPRLCSLNFSYLKVNLIVSQLTVANVQRLQKILHSSVKRIHEANIRGRGKTVQVVFKKYAEKGGAGQSKTTRSSQRDVVYRG
jgi:hypothetical protein